MWLRQPLRMTLAASLVALVCVLPPAGAAEIDASAKNDKTLAGWPLVFEASFPSTVTTVFSWDESTFGLFDPTNRTITLIERNLSSDAAFSASRTVQLEETVALPGGEIHPDPIMRRSDGAVIWLSRSSSVVGIYRDDGSLLGEILTATPSTFWMLLHTNGDIETFGTKHEARYAGYELYSQQGMLIRQEEGWLKPRTQNNAFTEIFFFETSEGRVEWAAHFPFIRVSNESREVMIDLIKECPAWTDDVRRLFAQDRLRNGLPKPLGDGLKNDHLNSLVTLAATLLQPDSILAILNGRVLARLTTAAQRLECWSFPQISSDDTYIFTSLAGTEADLAVLSRAADEEKVGVWIWRMISELTISP